MSIPRRSLRFPILLLALTSVVPAETSFDPAPSLPYAAPNACPFEGCTYRDWTALQDMPTYDTSSESRHQVGTLHKDEVVTALGGAVITYRPGTIHVDRDIPEAGLKRGDNILTYAYLGEGFSQVWFNGRFHQEFDISFTKWPDGTGCGGAHCAATYLDLGMKVWMAQLKLKSGATVWVDMGFPDGLGSLFNGVNLLAATLPTAPR